METILQKPNNPTQPGQPFDLAAVGKKNRDALVEYLTEMGMYGHTFEIIINDLYKNTDFFTGPSSTKWHAAYPGGGFEHVFNVTQCLVEMTQRMGLTWERPISPYVVGLFHDVTKLGAYLLKMETNSETLEVKTWYEYNEDCERLSPIHGEDSLLKVKQNMNLTEEEAACIRWHMGAYEGKDSWPGYDAAIKQFPNVLFTHTADMYASKVLETRLEDAHA